MRRTTARRSPLKLRVSLGCPPMPRRWWRRHVRGGDACNSFSRAQGPSLHRPPCVRGADAWSAVAQALAARGGGGGARPIVLLSTDDDETPAGRDGALSFSFTRYKYSHEDGWKRGAPDIEVRQSLPRFDVLRESLLDLGLLAQATLVTVGSFYSNFARIGWLLAGGALDYESFDALWCPFAICNAGRADAALICAGRRPLHIADIEQWGVWTCAPDDVAAEDVPKLESCEGVEHVHPARRPWSALMHAVKTRVLPLTRTDADNEPTAASEAECRRLFDEALKARMLKIY